ncbi:MAG: peptidylprolyl isomerase [Chitinivibrionales bacterium]
MTSRNNGRSRRQKKSVIRLTAMVLPISLGLVFAALFLMGFSCDDTVDSPIVARVGDAKLTLDDLYKTIPPEYSNQISREQMINYVKQWIDTELLYQEALRKKVHKEKDIRERLEQMKRDLLSAEIISRTSFAASQDLVSDEAIVTFYEAHRDSFIRQDDVFKYLEIIVDDGKTAWKVRNMVTKDNFLDLAVRYSNTPVQDPRSVPFIQKQSLPKELADAMSNLRVEGTTTPIKMEDGYHIIRILDKQDAGSICEVEEVREDIIGRLSTQAQKKDMERLLSDLRLKMDYEFNFSTIPGIETQNTESLSEDEEAINEEEIIVNGE